MAEIIEIKSVNILPNPVNAGGKIKITLDLEANESDAICSYCIFSEEMEANSITITV